MINLFLLQDPVDIRYFDRTKNLKDIVILPLTLSSMVFCHNNKLKYFNPIDFMKKNFHKKTIIESKKFEKKIKFDNKSNNTIKLEILVYLRFRFNSVAFLTEILEKINRRYKIKEIIIPGKNYNSHKIETFFLNEIFCHYLKQYKVKKISIPYSDESVNNESCYSYVINKKINNNKKNILLSNLGYNFKRLIYLKKFKKINLYYFSESRPNIVKNILIKFLNISPILIEKQNKIKNYENISLKINYNFKGKNLKELFSILIKKLSVHFIDLNQKGLAIKNFLGRNNFKLIIVNSARDVSGFFSELSQKKTKVLNISHGTVANGLNKFDKIYKENIASSVFTNRADYIAAQTKISAEYFSGKNLKKGKIIHGNLIFSEANQSKGKYLLYAVTTKTFYNMHFLGVEMYYEFFQNLKFLNKLSKDKKIKIIVKLHPSEIKNSGDLSIIFPYLNFSNSRIDKLLKKSFATLSFSSTVIEDSLNSKVPVILFDRWKRYKHCRIPKSKDNKVPLFYINKKENLFSCVEKIIKTDQFDFDSCVFVNGYKENIKENILKLI